MTTMIRAAFALFLVCSFSFAQINRATAVGRVTDSSGAVIAGGQLKMRRVATNEVFKAETTSSGDYTISNLPVAECWHGGWYRYPADRGRCSLQRSSR